MFNKPFNLIATCSSSRARLGWLSMLHGDVETPIFLPVGSQATIRALTPEDLDDIGIKMILCNAYHLYLRPGIDTVKESGGLHKFMGWNKPILTDSGGYQVFSLSSFRNIGEDGIVFRSHMDGSEHSISPESSVSMQEKLGADIIMALDVCPESSAKLADLSRAVTYTSLWAERCLQAHSNTGQHLFGIIQGGMCPDLRTLSAKQITSMDLPGYAIGGLSLGEPKTQMWQIVEHTVGLMPENKPRYLMGVGSPEDIIEGVARGIDVFDSALPTRVARNGALYTRGGRINIKRSRFKDVFEPVEKTCSCFACHNFTAAYMHHLFKCEELLAYRLATIHNLFFMQMLIEDVRDAIEAGRFSEFCSAFLAGYETTDENRRMQQKSRSLEVKREKRLSDFQ